MKSIDRASLMQCAPGTLFYRSHQGNLLLCQKLQSKGGDGFCYAESLARGGRSSGAYGPPKLDVPAVAVRDATRYWLWERTDTPEDDQLGKNPPGTISE
jgi:hypothetical protein